MSTFAIGDIHGNSDGLKDLLAQIGLDTSAFGVVTGIRLPEQRVFQSKQYAAAMASGKWKGR